MCEQTCYSLLVSVRFCVAIVTSLGYIKELHICQLLELLFELLNAESIVELDNTLCFSWSCNSLRVRLIG